MTIMADRATEEREYRPFEQIRDNYPKYLLTRSDSIQQRRAGPLFSKRVDLGVRVLTLRCLVTRRY